MGRSTGIQIIAVLIAAGLIAGSASMIPTINATRANLNILGSEDDLKNAPPEYAFAIQAFGAFRSLITNIAFIRAENYKNAGRYYDAFELAEWICKLQPYFPVVWEFHGWNMAWNISVTTFTPQERWHWVYNGVKLIRDQGVRRNPRAVNLYKQLAWTLFNKIGGDIDEFHMTYKRQWAWRMHLLMGPPPPPLVGDVSDELLRETLFSAEEDPFFKATETEEVLTRERIVEESKGRRGDKPADWDPNDSRKRLPADEIARIDEMRNDRNVLRRAAMIQMLKEIVSAPSTLEKLFALHPATRKMVGDLWSLGISITDETITEEDFLVDNGLGKRFFLPYRELATPGMIEQFRAESTRIPTEMATRDRLDQIVGVTRQDPNGVALVRFLQRKILLEAYNTDPAHMLAMTKQFGAMDWRLAEPMALYWVTKSIILAEGTPGSFENDKTNTFRIMLFSLQSLARRNKVFFDPVPADINYSYLNMLPDPAFIESMHEAYLRYAPRFDWRDPDASGAGDLFRSGHVNFLEEGVRTLHFAGRDRAAEKYLDYLREHYGRHPDGTVKFRYTLPIEDFAILGIRENNSLRREMQRVIRGQQILSLQAYSTGDYTYGGNLERLARKLHREWNAERQGVGAQRNMLPPFDEMYADTFRDLLSAPARVYVHVLEKARIWLPAPIQLRQRVYDAVLPQLTAECEAFQFDVAKAFPEPEGMAEFREKYGTREIEVDPEDESPAFTPIQPVDD
jgi:hypothetical protein